MGKFEGLRHVSDGSSSSDDDNDNKPESTSPTNTVDPPIGNDIPSRRRSFLSHSLRSHLFFRTRTHNGTDSNDNNKQQREKQHPHQNTKRQILKSTLLGIDYVNHHAFDFLGEASIAKKDRKKRNDARITHGVE